VMVTVTEIDIKRKRIALTMKGGGVAAASQPKNQNTGSGTSKKANKIVSEPVASNKEETYEDKLAQLKNMFKK